MDMVSLHGISKNYGKLHALSNVSLSIPQGSLYGLIGADGAGKSTLLQIVTTLLRPDCARGTVLGYDLAKDMAKIRQRIGMMTQKFSLYTDLSVSENLDFFSSLYGIPKTLRRRAIQKLLAFTHLDSAATRRAGRLSGGMKQKLALACALIHEPELLVLDEPSVGVDPVTRRDFWDLLGQLQADRQMTVLVSTPYMDEAARCSSLSFLHQGHVIAEGAPSNLCASLRQSLFRITAPSTLHWPIDRPTPHPLTHIYTMGGELRVAAPWGTTCNLVYPILQAALGNRDDISVASTEITIEDYLLLRLFEAV